MARSGGGGGGDSGGGGGVGSGRCVSGGLVATPTCWLLLLLWLLSRLLLFPLPAPREGERGVKHNILGYHCHLAATNNTVHYATTRCCFTTDCAPRNQAAKAPLAQEGGAAGKSLNTNLVGCAAAVMLKHYLELRC